MRRAICLGMVLGLFASATANLCRGQDSEEAATAAALEKLGADAQARRR